MKPLLDLLRIGPPDGRVWTRLFVLLACLVVGGTFLRAAWPKIEDPAAFAAIVFGYRVLPDRYINGVALLLPWLELVCGTALVAVPRLRAAAGWLVLAMLTLFIALLVSVIVRGIETSCGCLSVDESGDPIGWGGVARNVVLASLTLVVLWAHAGRTKPGVTDGASPAAPAAD